MAVGLSLTVFLLATACNGKPYAIEMPEMPAQPEMARTNGVFIIDHGYHAGLAIPAGPLEQRLPALQKRFGTAAYYELGWGQKEFYTAQDITTGLTLQAIFWPSAAAMRVAVVPYFPREYFYTSDVLEICLSDREFDSLLKYVLDSFYRDQAGNIVATKNGAYSHSQFYEAEGKYYLLNTSNKWTAKGLRSAGLDLWPSFNLTSGNLMANLRDSGRAGAAPCEAR